MRVRHMRFEYDPTNRLSRLVLTTVMMISISTAVFANSAAAAVLPTPAAPTVAVSSPTAITVTIAKVLNAVSDTVIIYNATTNVAVQTLYGIDPGPQPATFTLTVSNLTAGTSYYVTLTAVGNGGTFTNSPEGPHSSTIIPGTTLAKPAAPTVTVTSSTSINLSFTADVNASSSTVTVYNASNNAVTNTFLGAVSPVSVTGLTATSSYYATVTSIGNGTTYLSSLEGTHSVTVTPDVLLAPVAPTLAGASATSLTVTFSADPSAASSTVKIYSSTNTLVQTQTSAVSPLTVTGLTSGTAYYATVTSIGSGSPYLSSPEGAHSSPITLGTTLATPAAPSVTNATNTSLTVTFTADTNATTSTVKIYDSTNALIQTITSAVSPLSVTSLTATTSYYATVTSIGNGTTYLSSPEGAHSTSITPDVLGTPAAPSVAVVSSTSIKVTFTADVHAASSTVKVYDSSNTLIQTQLTSTSPQTISGLTSGTSYYATVTSIGGGSYLSSPEGAHSVLIAPGGTLATPAAPSIAVVSSTSIKVTFSVNASAASTTVKVYNAASNTLVQTATGVSTSPVTISSLLTAATYYATVTSVGNGGSTLTSLESAKSNTQALGVTLSTPVASSVASSGTTSITVTFSADTNAASSTVKIYDSTNALIQTITSAVSPLSVTSLTANTSYYATITSIGDGSQYLNSAEGAHSVLVTPGALAAPSAPSISAMSGTSLTVTFSADADATSVTVKVYNSSNGLVQTLTSVNSPLVVSGLTAGTSYYATVTSIGNGSTVANSAEGAHSATVALLATPAAPSVTGTSSSSITVTFSADASATSVTVKIYNASNGLVQTLTSAHSPLVVTGLTAGTSYYATISSIGNGSTVSNSAEGAHSVLVSPGFLATPSAPGITATSVTSLTVTFSADASATSETVKVYNASNVLIQTLTSAHSPLVVSGLTAGTSYYATVTSIGNGSTVANSAEGATSSKVDLGVVLVAPTPNLSVATSTSLQVNFPYDSNALSARVMLYSAATNSVIQSATVSSGSLDFTGLAPSTSYYATVTLIGSGTTYLTSTEGPRSSMVTPDAIATPAAPTISTLTSTSMVVSFGAIANASSYTVKVYNASNALLKIVTLASSPLSVTGLTAATSYFVSISAIGDGVHFQNSVEGSRASVTTPATAPPSGGGLPNATKLSRPGPPRVTAPSPTSLLVNFSRPAHATSTTVSLYNATTRALVTTSTTAATSVRFSNLSPFVTYYVSLTAVGDGVSYLTSAPGVHSNSLVTSSALTVGPFALFSVGLNGAERIQVMKLARFVVATNVTTVVLTGYSDNVGTWQVNLIQSLIRARSVAQVLQVDLKILNARNVAVRTVGRSWANPVASNATAAGREHNRRVVVTITGPRLHP